MFVRARHCVVWLCATRPQTAAAVLLRLASVHPFAGRPPLCSKLTHASTRVSHALNTLCALTLHSISDPHTRAASTRRRGRLEPPLPPRPPSLNLRCCSARTGAEVRPRINQNIVLETHSDVLFECVRVCDVAFDLSSRRPFALRVSASLPVRRCSLYPRRASVS